MALHGRDATPCIDCRVPGKFLSSSSVFIFACVSFNVINCDFYMFIIFDVGVVRCVHVLGPGCTGNIHTEFQDGVSAFVFSNSIAYASSSASSMPLLFIA